ncbi:autotransporter outer membrane beta-barrel domain-containing protein [Neorhizobium sp. T786]|uniref:autotransporter family protein n=1 Tax=Pseudorhizobium xiangyangii TaxID=2883104 RepID=UPI001CFFCB8D|nr:autotransporter outer membrane beta-barrel domain-containing protein [Neorhizobium xiangyangii]MCB5205529.1 autotransporter outer membrane beta-barrel domain-containing protein [Neorhizobium xiangyangii]
MRKTLRQFRQVGIVAKLLNSTALVAGSFLLASGTLNLASAQTASVTAPCVVQQAGPVVIRCGGTGSLLDQARFVLVEQHSPTVVVNGADLITSATGSYNAILVGPAAGITYESAYNTNPSLTIQNSTIRTIGSGSLWTVSMAGWNGTATALVENSVIRQETAGPSAPARDGLHFENPLRPADPLDLVVRNSQLFGTRFGMSASGINLPNAQISGSTFNGSAASVEIQVVNPSSINSQNNVYTLDPVVNIATPSPRAAILLGGQVTFSDERSSFFSEGGQPAIRDGGAGPSTSPMAGDQTVRLSGSTVVGDILFAAGDDTLALAAGTVMNGAIAMGTDDDTVLWNSIDPAGISLADGQAGMDTLTLANVVKTGALDLVNWETINLTAGSQLTLSDGLVLGDLGTGTGAFNIDASATLFAGGAMNPEIRSFAAGQFATVNNAGFIDVTNGGSGPADRLTIVGDYVGQNGQIILDTYLDTDGSPSDQLVIDGGTASGTSLLAVRNAGGPGALTVSDGIRVVDAINGATTGSGAFSLLGDYTTENGHAAVIGGAYAYTLHQNGFVDPADSDWYLRSRLTDPGVPYEPRYAPGVPVYESYPQLLQVMNGLPTLQQRVGNRYWKEAPPPAEPVFCKDPEQNFRCTPTAEQNAVYADTIGKYAVDQNGIWGRIEGAHSRFQPDVSTSASRYDVDLYRMQGGIDGLLHEGDQGRLLGGINLQYVHGKADVSSFFGDGEISATGYGIGGTLTWYGNNGVYVDGQAQLTWYDSNLTSRADDITQPRLVRGNDGFGYAVSLEAGRRFEMSDGWSITPQAQLVWSSVDFKSFTDPYGARVSLDRGDSLQGRLGVSVDRQASWTDDNGEIGRSHVYGIANLYNEFLDGSRVNVADVSFDSRNERLWAGVGLGGSYNWANDKYSLYGEGSVRTSLNHFADSYTLHGTVGFKVRF